MPIVKAAILTAILCAAPHLAFAEDHHAASSTPPCGWKGGSLPDPADTQRCLAERYKAPKPKPPIRSTDARPAANATDTATQ
jgi:hypothetical protein